MLLGIADTQLVATLDNSGGLLVEIPFTQAIAQTMTQIPRVSVPDLPDRMIAATALYNNVPVISRDHKIKAAILRTIW